KQEVVLLVAQAVRRIRAGETWALDDVRCRIAVQVECVVAVQVGLTVLDEEILVRSERHLENPRLELSGPQRGREGMPGVDLRDRVRPEHGLAPGIEARRKDAACLGDLSGVAVLDRAREEIARIHGAPDPPGWEERGGVRG